MSATLAPTIWDLAKDKFNSRAKRRRVPEDPEWTNAKRLSVVTLFSSSGAVLGNLTPFLAQPDLVSVVSIAFSVKAAVDATVNCVQTFRAARQSAIHMADPSEPQPTLTPMGSITKSALTMAFSAASGVPKALNADDLETATLLMAAALTLYATARIYPRGPGE